MTDADLQEITRKARLVQMTDEQREAQRRSFVFGNTNIENDAITRELVDEVGDRLMPDGRSR